ncbi:MAG: hypothetical protein KC561_09070, partial [Myxococcales bacterium]|nr:hypothetical protein [Myxococcales bacterium]
IDFDFFAYTDTNSSFVDLANVDSLEAPFGVTPEDFAAQARFGKSLGTELMLTLAVDFNEVFSLFAVGDIFNPGEFYQVEVDRVVGTSLGGQETFLGFTFGANAEF